MINTNALINDHANVHNNLSNNTKRFEKKGFYVDLESSLILWDPPDLHSSTM